MEDVYTGSGIKKNDGIPLFSVGQKNGIDGVHVITVLVVSLILLKSFTAVKYMMWSSSVVPAKWTSFVGQDVDLCPFLSHVQLTMFARCVDFSCAIPASSGSSRGLLSLGGR